jgi:PAS domain-containing protein
MERSMMLPFGGPTRDEARGACRLEAVRFHDRERVMCVWTDAHIPQMVCETAHRLRRSDNNYGPFAMRAVPFSSMMGVSGSGGGVSNEITEHQRLEDELRTNEKHFRLTFEQAAVGIAHVGIDGRWLLANPRLCSVIRTY